MFAGPDPGGAAAEDSVDDVGAVEHVPGPIGGQGGTARELVL
jgi:hypothetical protein